MKYIKNDIKNELVNNTLTAKTLLYANDLPKVLWIHNQPADGEEFTVEFDETTNTVKIPSINPYFHYISGDINMVDSYSFDIENINYDGNYVKLSELTLNKELSSFDQDTLNEYGEIVEKYLNNEVEYNDVLKAYINAYKLNNSSTGLYKMKYNFQDYTDGLFILFKDITYNDVFNDGNYNNFTVAINCYDVNLTTSEGNKLFQIDHIDIDEFSDITNGKITGDSLVNIGIFHIVDEDNYIINIVDCRIEKYDTYDENDNWILVEENADPV